MMSGQWRWRFRVILMKQWGPEWFLKMLVHPRWCLFSIVVWCRWWLGWHLVSLYYTFCLWNLSQHFITIDSTKHSTNGSTILLPISSTVSVTDDPTNSSSYILSNHSTNCSNINSNDSANILFRKWLFESDHLSWRIDIVWNSESLFDLDGTSFASTTKKIVHSFLSSISGSHEPDPNP